MPIRLCLCFRRDCTWLEKKHSTAVLDLKISVLRPQQNWNSIDHQEDKTLFPLSALPPSYTFSAFVIARAITSWVVMGMGGVDVFLINGSLNGRVQVIVKMLYFVISTTATATFVCYVFVTLWVLSNHKNCECFNNCIVFSERIDPHPVRFYLNKELANETRRCRCKIFSHWLGPWSVISLMSWAFKLTYQHPTCHRIMLVRRLIKLDHIITRC